MTRQPMAFPRSGSTRSAALRAGAAWWFCGLLPPVAFRALIWIETDLPLQALDLRGALSDVASGLLVASALMTATRVHRWLPRALLVLWILICLGDAEHILANGSHLRAAYAGFLTNSTFLLGSVFQTAFPVVATVVILAAGVAAWLAGRIDPHQRLPVRSTLGAAFVLYFTVLSWRLDIAHAEWRQISLMEAQVRDRTSQASLDPGPHLSAVNPHDPPDLGGQWWPETPEDTPNVLIILLEALSGAHIPSLAEAHGVRADPALPELDRLAQEHIAFSSFIAQQRQTNRGEFALLCGAWPKLRTSVPRMSEYSRETGPLCLPEALQALGFTTVYLQAAPLGFMLKDQFMSRIGFERVLGNASFPTAQSRTNWGVDDATLFDGALAEIEVLEKQKKPWMMTLLTVGTHHPYNVPKSSAFEELTGFERAARYADAALADFIQALEHQGILKNTLVLITSDESRGLPEQANVDPVTLLLSRNWSFLIAITPEDLPRRIDTPFTQSDLTLSILDYIAAATTPTPMQTTVGSGRSLFRVYSEPRSMAFANTYQSRIFHADPAGELAVCREDLSACSRFSMPPDRPFQARSPAIGDLSPDELHSLDTWLFAPDLNAREKAGPESIALIGPQPIPILEGPARYQIIFGGQGLELPVGAEVELALDVRLNPLNPREAQDGRITLRTNLLASDQPQPLLSEELPLQVGERLRLRYRIVVGSPLHQAEARFVVIDRSGQPAQLVFKQATLTVQPPTESARSGPHQITRDKREIVSVDERSIPENS